MALSTNNFEINGVIDTKNTVLQNIQTMAMACGVWLTFDGTAGKWAVVINKAGPSVRSFNDSNIIGGINISGTGVNEMYNSVSVSFPHGDLLGQTDYVDYELPLASRYPNERDNPLNISLDCINNSLQASYVGIVALKQSRADKVIQFNTDYSALGTKAGDIIDITNSMYGFLAKKFRVTKVSEDDSGDGTINISITAVEYDDATYSDEGLTRKDRNKRTGILPKDMNDVLDGNDTDALNARIRRWHKVWEAPFVDCIDDMQFHNHNFGLTFTAPFTGIYKYSVFFNWGVYLREDGSEPAPPSGIVRGNKLYVAINNVDHIPADPSAETGLTGSRWTPILDDYNMSIIFEANKGDTIMPKYSYITNWPTNWTPPAGYPSYTTYPTDGEFIVFLGELQYIGVPD